MSPPHLWPLKGSAGPKVGPNKGSGVVYSSLLWLKLLRFFLRPGKRFNLISSGGSEVAPYNGGYT